MSDSAIATGINAARAAPGDNGSAQQVIRPVPRRGYRLMPEVARGEAPGSVTDALPDKPSVAVLPFQNISGEPERTYFSDGITDDIITDIARYNELFVIARHSSFAYRDTAAPPHRRARSPRRCGFAIWPRAACAVQATASG